MFFGLHTLSQIRYRIFVKACNELVNFKASTRISAYIFPVIGVLELIDF